MELLQKLIDADFLFKNPPAADFNSLLPLIVICGALIVLSIASMLVFRKVDLVTGRVKSGLNSWMISLGLVGLAIIFFRSQQLSFLSKNFILELIGLVWLIWLVSIIVYIFRKYPHEKYALSEKERIQKYIPKPKKRKRKK